ncbi:hypothetical protein JYK00_06130 [Thermosipho ferrireducens]|uniref:Porin n=1 Tax=Thermosipho ferrireducens TaxID=2571116 RepID=A0ABX7S4I6_9BACT|nr:hypothetical protein [Thermosipho ferrireducens]QTA37317.1 hypothetical protein JYK00_06130 [Thermosipho ferrireducens]
MKKLLVLLVSVLVLGFAFAEVTFSGGITVEYTFNASTSVLTDSVGLDFDRIQMTASGDGYYLRIRFYDESNTFSIDQAYVTLKPTDSLSVYLGKKGYWLNPYAFFDNLIWGRYGSAWYYPKEYLGVKYSFDMGSVYVTLDPRYEKGAATPSVNVFGTLSFDPVSLGFIADDNFKSLGFGVTGSFDIVTVSGAFGYSLEDSTITALLVGAEVSIDPVKVLVESDLTDFNAIALYSKVTYPVSEPLTVYADFGYTVGDNTSLAVSAWGEYAYNDNVTLTPKVAYSNDGVELSLSASFGF